MERVRRQYRRVRGSESAMQVGSFGVVGVINTVVDFAIFNTATLLLQIPVVPANIVSTTFAQIGSFLLNRQFVFKKQKKHLTVKTVVQFIGVTMTGLYVVQGLVLYTFVHTVPLPGLMVTSMLHSFGLVHIDDSLVVANVAKVIATVFSAAWNYVWYKKIVFKKQPEQE